MKKNNPSKFIDFTRGSEIWIHQLKMFLTGISNVLILGVFLTISIMGLFLYLKLDNRHFYALKTEMEIVYKQSLNVPNQEIELVLNNEPTKLTIEQAEQVVQPYVNKFWWAVKRSLLIGLIFSFAIVGGLIWYWYSYGRKIMEDEQLRGAKLVEKEKLIELIQTNKDASPYKIAGVPMRKGTEGTNVCFVGAPFSGKSQAIRALLAQIRGRGKKVICYDPSGEFTQEFYREGKDIILNPFDERSPQWNVWNEVEEDHHIDSIGDALIPITPNGDQFFPPAARRLIADVIRVLGQNENTKTNKNLYESISLATLQELHEMLAGTSGATYVDPKTEKTGVNIKMQILNYLTPFRYLKDEGEKFSIRNWIHEEDDSWIFITTKEEQKEAIKPIISLWISTAIKATMSLPAIHRERMWLCIDEMPTLQKMDDLVLSLTNTRKYGLCHIIGLQDFSQCDNTYGKDVTSTIISTLQTKLILRVTDSVSAERLSKIIGQMEVDEKNMSRSMGVQDNRDGDSFYSQRKERNIVMPSEIMDLPNLVGYLKIVGNYPVAKVTTTYVPFADNAIPFIPRKKSINIELIDELTTRNPKVVIDSLTHKTPLEESIEDSESPIVNSDATSSVKVEDGVSNPGGDIEQSNSKNIELIDGKTDPVAVNEEVVEEIKSDDIDMKSETKKTVSLSDELKNESKANDDKKTYQTSFFDNMDDLTGSK
ncbi:type IV secretion system DNA-binding domain-containing protein [Acinetobacter beijerinckii]|uniref:Type IV conjugative transfer system coupling protein TraD n=1 Tax=Acinetobacter beijerinckii CIP 110307 TaxID=1217648 RepID=N9FDI0_9GAMM|nr:type IV secretion system DNA-binding domain-containing protein [Acinetobacter beijerinckii]ENW02936.1 type IV conjugative transfer system coupling protein TraD [Acinetobacter beijerinckii CIP 110307]